MIKKALLTLFYLGISISIQAQHVLNLADMDLSKGVQEYGNITIGKSATGETVVVDGKTYHDVVGVHAKFVLKIDLQNDASRFKAIIGIPESNIDYTSEKDMIVHPLVDGSKIFYKSNKGGKSFAGLAGANGKVEKGSVCFIIKGDGKELYNSGVVRSGDKPKEINLPLNGVRLLELSVTPTSDGPSGDNAVWIRPQIIYNSIPPSTVNIDIEGEGPKIAEATRELLLHIIKALPTINHHFDKADFDWLINADKSKAGVYATADSKGIILCNNLVARTFRIIPNLATIDIQNLMTEESLLRAVSGEGSISIDGKRYDLGGLQGQPERGYLKPEWVERLTTIPNSFIVEDFEISPIEEDIKWARSRWALNKDKPTGKTLTFTMRGQGELKDILVKIHYSLYDKLPVIRKSFDVYNKSAIPVNIDAFCLENLAFAEPESPVGGDPSKFRLPNIHVESDYACGGGFTEMETDITEKWVTDPNYTSQRNYLLQTPCILQVAPPLGPDYTLQPQSVFESFHVYEMPFDSDDRERKGLFKRRMYRTLTPWATENPIFMHLTSSDPKVIRTAVDQCAETGYEMIIISFGSGLNAEDISEANIAKWKGMVDYAKSKGIEMGCYSLLSSRWISDDVDVINPATGKRGGMRFGSAPCLCSDWGKKYFEKIRTFFEKTGMRCFEHDGSYPGDVCASTSHTYHKGLADSQWNQFYKIRELYRWMCESGIYMNVPDFYFFNGTNKTGIGYREANWSLPRDRQIIHARQLNYDGTWDRMASACWSFVPLVEYHGGGKEATLEPLNEHIFEYKTHLMQNYGSGVQACYRGPRLYDTPETKAMVQGVISWYKKYREILNSDIIHLRRPDGRDWDGFLHVNPKGKEKGLAMFFNPTDKEITRTIDLPLYYTGLTKTAKIREGEGKSKKYKLKRNYTISLTINIPANGSTWFVIE